MNFQYPDTVLLIFAKAPEPGKVKTRLISVLGKEAACEFYSKMASDIISRLTDSMLCPIVLYCYPDTNHIFFKKHEQKFNLELKRQEGIDLGERMFHSIKTALDYSTKAIIIGTDCPSYSEQYIEEAVNQLDKFDVVLGPATDGGYVLIGMKEPHHQLFNDIKWSTNTVLQSTVTKIKENKLSYYLLSPLNDIDEPGDLQFL